MPKARTAPLSCLFAINKPTGHVSMQLLNKLQPLFASSSLFKDPNAQTDNGGGGGGRGKGKGRRKWKDERVKMGQGGTLDPLADGVLVIGINGATKKLSTFLDCTKEYRAIGLLGCSTDSFDSEGKRVRTTPFAGITAAKIEAILSQFRGEIEQTPPIFSALKMDGKPLYEYARSNTPLPRPIPSRKVTVFSLELLRFVEGDGHAYEYPKEELDDAAKKELERLERMVKEGGTTLPAVEEVAESAVEVAPETMTTRPPIFEISLTVSSGTYVRSIIHDIAVALGSSAHVVKLTRTRQGEFTLEAPAPAIAEPILASAVPVSTPDFPAPTPDVSAPAELATSATAPAPSRTPAAAPLILETFPGGCIEWTTLEAAIRALEMSKKSGELVPGAGEDGLLPWETEILHKCKEV